MLTVHEWLYGCDPDVEPPADRWPARCSSPLLCFNARVCLRGALCPHVTTLARAAVAFARRELVEAVERAYQPRGAMRLPNGSDVESPPTRHPAGCRDGEDE